MPSISDYDLAPLAGVVSPQARPCHDALESQARHRPDTGQTQAPAQAQHRHHTGHGHAPGRLCGRLCSTGHHTGTKPACGPPLGGGGMCSRREGVRPGLRAMQSFQVSPEFLCNRRFIFRESQHTSLVLS